LRLILAIFIIFVLLSLHRLVLIDIIPGPPTLCYYSDPTVGLIVWQLEIALYNYVPCLLIFIANVLILIVLFISKNENLGKMTSHNRNETKLLISLLLVSSLYVVLLMPLSTLFTYLAEERDNLSQEQATLLYNLVKLLTQVSIVNYCQNFIIYGCTLPFYRQEARLIIRALWDTNSL
jgi:hypothetical protein